MTAAIKSYIDKHSGRLLMKKTKRRNENKEGTKEKKNIYFTQ